MCMLPSKSLVDSAPGPSHHNQCLRKGSQYQVFSESPPVWFTITAAAITKLLKLRRNWLVRLLEDTDKVFRMACFAACEESVRRPCCARTTGAAHAVDVVLDLPREIVIDNVLDVLHVDAARRDVGRYEDGGLPSLELVEHPVALLLLL
eukprot:CAMPEP_0179333606 /NCGR_PEP_ID=MMETSP0797-20121207/65441_1 /TAXON_ID=47934 /ORGANISM="Dinophysis acuminata, Strain DAEP01" /LENGTH=148 /DNA_ID=CAMNT_0021046721 /DNA_START=101 /DNA_END=543 /DNA_ORIENTATION=-